MSGVLTQDVNKCEKNVEIEKTIFSWHVARRTFLQIHEKWPPAFLDQAWKLPFLRIAWQFFFNLP